MTARQVYWHYATIVIPASTVIYKAADWSTKIVPVPVTVRARRQVNRRDEPISGSAWMFNYGAYAYRLPLTVEVAVSNERKAVRNG